MQSFRRYPFLLVLALGLTLLSVPVDATCGMDPEPADDSCCTGAADSACGDDRGRVDDDGCANGCLDCRLPCCSRTVMITTSAPTPGPAPSVDGLPTVPEADAIRVDADPPERPPRR